MSPSDKFKNLITDFLEDLLAVFGICKKRRKY